MPISMRKRQKINPTSFCNANKNHNQWVSQESIFSKSKHYLLFTYPRSLCRIEYWCSLTFPQRSVCLDREPQNSKYRGVEYIPITLWASHSTIATWFGLDLYTEWKMSHTEPKAAPAFCWVGGIEGCVAQNYTDKPQIHRWNLWQKKIKMDKGNVQSK